MDINLTTMGCGACNNVICSTHGCQRFCYQPPFVWPTYQHLGVSYVDEGTQVFNAQQEIADLKRRVLELEKKAQEPRDEA